MDMLVAALAGLMVATVVIGILLRWLGVLYAQVFLQPPEMRRFSQLAPLLLLHSGPWTFALVIFAVAKLSAGPLTSGRAWFLGGAALGSAWMLFIVFAGLQKLRLSSGGSHAR